MRPVVIFASSSGNTEKVALAIAEALQCPAAPLRQVNDHGTPLTPERWQTYDLFLLGSGIIAGHFSEKIKEFMETIAPSWSERPSVFSARGRGGARVPGTRPGK